MCSDAPFSPAELWMKHTFVWIWACCAPEQHLVAANVLDFTFSVNIFKVYLCLTTAHGIYKMVSIRERPWLRPINYGWGVVRLVEVRERLWSGLIKRGTLIAGQWQDEYLRLKLAYPPPQFLQLPLGTTSWLWMLIWCARFSFPVWARNRKFEVEMTLFLTSAYLTYNNKMDSWWHPW